MLMKVNTEYLDRCILDAKALSLVIERNGMIERLDLQPRHRKQIEAMLREQLPGVEVWAYGSRVNGRGHGGSDLDLVLRGPDLQRLPSGKLSDLTEAFRESNIPFLIEALDWARLPESFHREIERDYVVLVRGAERTVGRVSDAY